jgi:hypothetical protein
MSDEEAPPPLESVPPDSPHERGSRESRRRRLEGVIPEIVRRAVELGVEKAQEAPDNLKSFVGDLKLPKEIAHYLLQQIDETKSGLFRVVAKEIRDFLEHTNFAGEVQKLLTTVQFEVNTTIRFTPNDGRKPTKKSGPENSGPDDDGSDDDGDTGEAPSARDDEHANEPSEGRPTPLPKPEVKTAVHVRRADREPRRRRDRAT